MEYLKKNKFLVTFSGVTISWLAIYYILESYSLWSYWGVQNMEIMFPDLHILLSAIDAHFLGINVFKENPLCYFKIPHVYSEAWFPLHYIGFSDDYRILIGLLLILFFALGVSWQIKDYANLFLPLCISPAVLLAVERCNNDLIIFSLLFIVVKFALSEKKHWILVGHILLYALIALKYYPVALSVIFLFRKEKLYRKLFHISAPIIFFLLWICYCWNNLQIQKNTIPEPGYVSSFGFSPFNSLISYTTGLKIEVCFILLVILTSFIAYSIFRFLIKYTNKKDVVTPANRYSSALCFGGCSILLFCYFVKTSFDYRMIFLFCSLPFILKYQFQFQNYFPSIFLSPICMLVAFTLSTWFEFIREWISIITRNTMLEVNLPSILFLTRASEICLNHYSIILLFSFALYIAYKEVFCTAFYDEH